MIVFDFTAYEKAIDEAIAALGLLAEAFGSALHTRELSSAGSWAFAVARSVGFLPLEIYAWLESCPGAFADEFGDGWK